MKIHDGQCSRSHACTRTHGYKCRLTGNWFKTEGSTHFDTDRQLYIFPFWPVCSAACFDALRAGVLGQFWVPDDDRAQLVDGDHAHWDKFRAEFPNEEAHLSFNSLMKETKEMK